MFTHTDFRNRYDAFWKKRAHSMVPPIPLVPQNDPTTLFTGSGMQQLVPYLLGEPHPLGKRLYNVQPCLRSQDIEEIGDNRHTTFFEMVGNWSLGDYFKDEQIEFVFDFFTNKTYGLGLDPNRLYVSVFSGSGNDGIAEDETSIAKWKALFAGVNIEAKHVRLFDEETGGKLGMQGGRIFSYNAKKNWWSRAGVPENMPPGEPGGPDTECFYLFPSVPHDTKYGENCHPNCDCGRFIEIGNSVFMQFKKNADGSFSELPKPNVDFGGGLERLLAAVNDTPDVFMTDLYMPILETIESVSGREYADETNKKAFRIIADHIKGAIMLITMDIFPSNKEQGYVVRRMLRRSIWYGRHYLNIGENFLEKLVDPVVAIYGEVYPEAAREAEKTRKVLNDEETRFRRNLEKGMHEVPKIAARYQREHGSGGTGNTMAKTATGRMLFFIYESYGFPPDLTVAMLEDKGWSFDKNFEEDFQNAKKAHQDKSRAGAEGKFKGGLADNSEQVLRYHTATHLLHQALFDVLGAEVKQEGSNITGERLRFDFRAATRPTPEQIAEVERIVNEKISAGIPVQFQMMPKEKAEKVGAKSFFKEKYPETVKVYYIGTTLEDAYSKEFCGGPHVANTREIGSLTITKIEKIGSNVFRLYAQ
ncbi:MAG: alanine--tRNA ligase [Patescibacteria group bacterium]|nr:alanine--tRNA ligase [Patescibacteria group bacterium]